MEGVSLRPGGSGGLLTAFALGSRPLKQSSAGSKEEKGYDEVIKYDRAVLLAFKEVRRPAAGCPRRAADVLLLQRCTSVPAELEHSGSELLLGSADNEFVTPEERCVGASPPASRLA